MLMVENGLTVIIKVMLQLLYAYDCPLVVVIHTVCVIH